MGFDLTGLNPEASTPQPVWSGDEPMIKTGENSWTIDPQIKEEYDDYMKSRWEWQDATDGAYFRNNVWFWRPLWSYVCSVCYDILSDKDMRGGDFNDGYMISRTKAKKIASKLRKMLENGHVELVEAEYKLDQDQLPEGDFEKSYPFNTDNVREFERFCEKSGGFEIW
jgi:hypothetical protein